MGWGKGIASVIPIDLGNEASLLKRMQIVLPVVVLGAEGVNRMNVFLRAPI